MAMISIGHEYAAAVEATRARLGVSGTWFDADEVRAIVARADARSRQRSSAPWHHELPDSTEILRLSARAVIDRIASDPGSVDAGWAAEQIGDLGEGPYVELVGTTAVAVALRLFADAVDGLSEKGRDRQLTDITRHTHRFGCLYRVRHHQRLQRGSRNTPNRTT